MILASVITLAPAKRQFCNSFVSSTFISWHSSVKKDFCSLLYFSDTIALDSGIPFLFDWLYSVLLSIHFDAHVSKYDQWEPSQAGSCALRMSSSVSEHFHAVTTICFRHSLCFSATAVELAICQVVPSHFYGSNVRHKNLGADSASFYWGSTLSMGRARDSMHFLNISMNSYYYY